MYTVNAPKARGVAMPTSEKKNLITFLEEHYANTESIAKDIFSKL